MPLSETPLSEVTQESLRTVTSIMRELSRLTDPDDAAELYGNGLRKLKLVPNDRYLGLSRRELGAPQFRITRNSSWKEHPNPWTERHKLPLLSGGILSEILYSNEPAVIPDLPARLSKGDPAYEYLEDMELLVGLPHFDNGESINFGIILCRKCEAYPLDSVPMMLWMANLWGRATLNLVNRQKLDEAYRRLDRELKVVGEIQKSLLPRALPELPGIDMAAHYRTSARAGGDYYDFFPLPEGKWGIFVADVSGHGTPAAVMMAITHAIAHSHPGHPTPPGRMLSYLNSRLVQRYTGDNGTFVTALYAILDPAARTLVISSAGHPLPRVIRKGVPTMCPVETSLPLGLATEETYVDHTLHLEPGDRVLLFTDGIIEAFGAAGDLFGSERLDAAAAGRAGNASTVLMNILADVSTFTEKAAPADDQTLLVLVME
ncbi:MAG: PP2C family protein-serine/threonine phosphatase [Phycisphaerae bacterium]